MRFAFSDDQLLFRDAVRDLLAKECDATRVRSAWASTDGRLPEVWTALAEMGVLGVRVPEAHGGLGLDEVDLVLLLEEAGRAALPGPLVDTVAVAAPLLGELADADADLQGVLHGVVDGSVTVATRIGGPVLAPMVAGAAAATHLLIDGDDDLVLVAPSACELTPQPSVDGARRLAEVVVPPGAGRVLARGPQAAQAAGRALDRGALATAAELVGVSDRMLALAVAYVKERHQFGVPIGSFQAVKHHLADALLRIEFARPAVYAAAWSLAQGSERASVDVSLAKALASDAARLTAGVALQAHGAIGYTVECDLHLWMKRAWALAPTWGDAAWHRRRIGDAVLGPA